MDGYVILVTAKNAMLTIPISKPTKHGLDTSTKVENTSDIPLNTKEIQQKEKIIMKYIYNGVLDDANEARKINTRKNRDSRDSDFWK